MTGAGRVWDWVMSDSVGRQDEFLSTFRLYPDWKIPTRNSKLNSTLPDLVVPSCLGIFVGPPPVPWHRLQLRSVLPVLDQVPTDQGKLPGIEDMDPDLPQQLAVAVDRAVVVRQVVPVLVQQVVGLSGRHVHEHVRLHHEGIGGQLALEPETELGQQQGGQAADQIRGSG